MNDAVAKKNLCCRFLSKQHETRRRIARVDNSLQRLEDDLAGRVLWSNNWSMKVKSSPLTSLFPP